MEKVLLVGLLFYILQTIFTCFQIKNFKKNFKALRMRGTVGLGQKKKTFGAGTVVILVSDENGVILEGRLMKGFSVFARFREIEGVAGVTIEELRGRIMLEDEKKRNTAMLDAITHIESQLYPQPDEDEEELEGAVSAN